MSVRSTRLKRAETSLQLLIKAAKSRMENELTAAERFFMADWKVYLDMHGRDAVLARYPEQEYPHFYRWAECYRAGAGRPRPEPFAAETEETRQRLESLPSWREASRKKLQGR